MIQLKLCCGRTWGSQAAMLLSVVSLLLRWLEMLLLLFVAVLGMLISEKVICLLTGVEAESRGSAPSRSLQQVGRNRQAPRGNKARHRPGSTSHPPAASLAPAIDGHGSSAKKIGQARWRSIQAGTWSRSVCNTCAVCAVCPAAPNIDRSVKDLQRCTASLTRYRMVIKDEMDSSIKSMKLTFADLQSWCAVQPQ